MDNPQQDQPQHNNTMRIVTPSEAGHPLAVHTITQNQNQQTNGEDTLVVRSNSIEEDRIRRKTTLSQARALLDSVGLSDVSIDIAMDTQSSLHIETAHDGTITKLLAFFESYTACSNASLVSFNDHLGASNFCVDSTTSCTMSSSEEQICKYIENQTIAQTIGQSDPSPRKPIPAQWLHKTTSPNLATAQRAKERTLKKGSENGSPRCAKTVRATRSSMDLGRPHGREGTTYLTKEALEAVDATIVSPLSPTSPVTFSNSVSKPAWNSPTSPLRGVARKQSRCSLKMSPTKPSHPSTKSVTTGHTQAVSSVTALASKISHRTTDGSPVRSPESTRLGFRSTLKDLEDLHITILELETNDGFEQTSRNANTTSLSNAKAKAERQATLARAKLALRISVPNTGIDYEQESETMTSKNAKAPGSNDSMSPVSATTASRIPRVDATTRKPNLSRIPALQRTKSTGTMRPKAKVLRDVHVDSNEVAKPNTPTSDTSHDHADENTDPNATKIQNHGTDAEMEKDGKTQNVLSQDQQAKHAHFDPSARPAEHFETGLYEEDNHQSEPSPTESYGFTSPDSSRTHSSRPFRRVASSSSERGLRIVTDPILADSAIIYSRVKSDSAGNALFNPAQMQSMPMMMAHSPDIGSSSTATFHSAPSATSEHVVVSEKTEPMHATSEDRQSGSHSQVGSEESTHPSVCSDLRATATEFVPKLMLTSGPTELATEPPMLASLQDVAGLPDTAALDRNSIPFLWYMYGIQFAYEQGFRNGRPKSPRKFKPKKPRGPVPSSGDPHYTRSPDDFALSVVTASSPSAATEQRTSSVEFGSLPTGPAYSPHPSPDQGYIQSNFTDDGPIENTCGPLVNQPFTKQYDKIAEHAAASTHKSDSVPRHYNIDFTRIQNTNFPTGPRSMQFPAYHHKMSRYDYRNSRRSGNGLYGGSGRGNAAGIPIGATAPFPNPVPPQGRPGQIQSENGSASEYSAYSVAREACGMVDIVSATELVGGGPCNACDPDHY
jgi:hypothetical protein